VVGEGNSDGNNKIDVKNKANGYPSALFHVWVKWEKLLQQLSISKSATQGMQEALALLERQQTAHSRDARSSCVT
jgi:uncharacterized protein YecA (UPF0149 family)